MGINAIGPIGQGDEDKRTQYTTNQKRKMPEIGNLLNNFNVNMNLPSNFNSAFTVGKPQDVQGAFGD